MDDFKVIPAHIDEDFYFNKKMEESKKENYLEKIKEAMEYLAYQKAKSVYEDHKDLVLASDTLVICGDRIMGKPQDEDEAYDMLSYLLGKKHQVVTATALIDQDKTRTFSVVSQVNFIEKDDYSLDLIRTYIREERPLDKAGAYGIQDKKALFIDSIEGDYYSIVGLSLSRISRELFDL